MHKFDNESDICDNCGLTSQSIEEFAVQCGEKWERRGHTVTNFLSGVTEHCRSINEAKRISRGLQFDKLGHAGMRVIK